MKNKKRGRKKKEEYITEKQRKFIEGYADHGNAVLAAREAQYGNPSKAACLLLNEEKYPLVVKEINLIRLQKRRSASVKGEEIVRELASIGFMNPKNCIDKNGNMLSLKDMPDEVAVCISHIDIDERMTREGESITSYKLRFHDKLNALNQLQELLGYKKSPLIVNSTTVNNISLTEGERAKAIQGILALASRGIDGNGARLLMDTVITNNEGITIDNLCVEGEIPTQLPQSNRIPCDGVIDHS